MQKKLENVILGKLVFDAEKIISLILSYFR